MPIPNYTLPQIEDTDTFKQWADKCKGVITALNYTNFVTEEVAVTLTTDQIISGIKTIENTLKINRDLEVFNPNYDITFDGNNGLFNIFKRTHVNTVIDFNETFAGEAPVHFVKGPYVHTMGFDSEDDEFQTLKTSADWSTPRLVNTSENINLNSIEYILPEEGAEYIVDEYDKALPHWLRNVDDELSWLDEDTFVNVITTKVLTELQDLDFTLPEELFPVGMIFQVDRGVLDSFENIGSPNDGPWGKSEIHPLFRVCDGSTLSYDEDATPPDVEYREVCQILDSSLKGQSSGSIILQDLCDYEHYAGEINPPCSRIAWLIKAKPDPSTGFQVQCGNGINVEPLGPFLSEKSPLVNAFDIYGAADLSLNIDTENFEFTGDGRLTFNNDLISVANQPDTLVRRDFEGKIYVEQALIAEDPSDEKNVATMGWSTQYFDNQVDKLVKRFTGSTHALASTGSFSSSMPYMPYQDLSLIDADYTVRYWGYEEDGKAGLTTRNTSTGKNNIRNYGNKSLIIDRVNPQQDENHYLQTAKSVHISRYIQYVIDEDDVLYAIGNNTHGAVGKHAWNGSFVNYPYETDDLDGIARGTVKKLTPAMIPGDASFNWIEVDWFEYDYLSNDEGHKYAVVKSKDKDDIYGRVYQIADDSNGALGLGSSGNSTDPSSGSVEWGPTGGQQSLWHHFATDPNNLEETFHYNINDDNQWYIKKVWVLNSITFAIIARNGDTTGDENQLWASGYGLTGTLGRGSTNEINHHMAPVVERESERFMNPVTATDGISMISNDHGLSDYDVIQIYGRYYYVRVGDSQGNNKENAFKLYKSIGEGTDWFTNPSYSENIFTYDPVLPEGQVGITPVFRVYSKLEGVEDVVFGLHNSDRQYSVTARLNNKTAYGWGYNINGGTGVNSTLETIVVPTRLTGYAYEGVDKIHGGLHAKGNVYMEKHSEIGGGNIRKDFYTFGHRVDGLTGDGGGDGVLRSWVRVNPVNTSAEKIFVLQGYRDISSIVDIQDYFESEWRSGNVFFVSRSITGQYPNRLYAAGSNRRGRMGTTNFYDDVTPRYTQINFPEDPMNIVQMATNLRLTWALCKTNPDDDYGRVYIAGDASEYSHGYNQGDTQTIYDNWTKWDHFITL